MLKSGKLFLKGSLVLVAIITCCGSPKHLVTHYPGLWSNDYSSHLNRVGKQYKNIGFLYQLSKLA